MGFIGAAFINLYLGKILLVAMVIIFRNKRFVFIFKVNFTLKTAWSFLVTWYMSTRPEISEFHPVRVE
jgi:hypothetical protein